MIENEDDLAAWLGLDPPAKAAPPAEVAALVEAAASGPAHIEELADRLGRPAIELAAALSRLELDGWVGRDGAGRYLAIRTSRFLVLRRLWLRYAESRTGRRVEARALSILVHARPARVPDSGT